MDRSNIKFSLPDLSSLFMILLLSRLMKSLFVTFKDGYGRVLNFVVLLFTLVDLRGTKVRIWLKTPPCEKKKLFRSFILPT